MIGVRPYLVLLCVLVSVPLLAADRTLVAEGAYVARTKDGTKPYDHWKVWREPGATFSVEVTSSNPAGPAQTFNFDHKLLPSGYALTVTRRKEGDKVGMTCGLDNGTLSCDILFEGKTSSTSTKVSGPCLVMVDNAFGLDLAWFFASALRIVSVDPLKPLCAYILEEKKLGEFSLEVDSSPVKIVSAGEETTEILGKRQTVRTYQLGNDDVWTVKVLPSGLVASMSIEGEAVGGIELAEYKEYERWAP